MSQNLQKIPSKGILKSSRSVDAQDGQHTGSSSRRTTKEQRFDESNILETFHPANKDYGHMKIDEPKTPYSESVDGEADPSDQVDANILAAKLAASMNRPPKCAEPPPPDSDDDMEEPEESRQRRKEFEKKRKMHYNEFQALQLARKLMEQDDDEDEDGPSTNQT